VTPVEEMHSLPVRWVVDLPLPVTLKVTSGTPPAEFDAWWTWDRVSAQEALTEGLCTWTPMEIHALVLACEVGRSGRADYIAWCSRKARDPRWRLGAGTKPGEAFGAGPRRGQNGLDRVPDVPGVGWTVGRLLGHLQARLGGFRVTGRTGEEPVVWSCEVAK